MDYISEAEHKEDDREEIETAYEETLFTQVPVRRRRSQGTEGRTV